MPMPFPATSSSSSLVDVSSRLSSSTATGTNGAPTAHLSPPQLSSVEEIRSPHARLPFDSVDAEVDDLVNYEWLRLLSTSSFSSSSCDNSTSNSTNATNSSSTNCTSAVVVATTSTTTTTSTTPVPAGTSTAGGSDKDEFGLYFYLFFGLLGFLALICCVCVVYSCCTGYCSELHKWHVRWFSRTPGSKVAAGDLDHGLGTGNTNAENLRTSLPVEQQSIKSGEDFNFDAFFFAGADDEGTTFGGKKESRGRGVAGKNRREDAGDPDQASNSGSDNLQGYYDT
ncbi:unnamed protein product [Amoebophrya sp. A120]|nr:unnamed protein product [Amoebophrya sp. A120]|eukprot:GSA120T00011345001.1